MSKLIIQGTPNTPEINFNLGTGEFWIDGHSYFNNSGEFFLGIIDWVNEQTFKAGKTIKLHISLEYFDSSSKKGVVELIKALIHGCKNSSLEVFWHYNHSDLDSKSTGEEFAAFFEM